jgi:hypothetical protein
MKSKAHVLIRQSSRILSNTRLYARLPQISRELLILLNRGVLLHRPNGLLPALRFAQYMYTICITLVQDEQKQTQEPPNDIALNDCLTLSAEPAYTRSAMNQIAKRLGRKLIVGLLSSIFLIVAGGATLTVYTARAYAGTCSQLSGFPGLLQRMGFFATGTCVTKIAGTVCAGGTACTVDGNAGTCKNTAALGQTPVCACVANTVSKQ